MFLVFPESGNLDGNVCKLIHMSTPWDHSVTRCAQEQDRASPCFSRNHTTLFQKYSVLICGSRRGRWVTFAYSVRVTLADCTRLCGPLGPASPVSLHGRKRCPLPSVLFLLLAWLPLHPSGLGLNVTITRKSFRTFVKNSAAQNGRCVTALRIIRRFVKLRDRNLSTRGLQVAPPGMGSFLWLQATAFKDKNLQQSVVWW